MSPTETTAPSGCEKATATANRLARARADHLVCQRGDPHRPDKQQQHDVRPSLLLAPVAAQSGSVTRCWFHERRAILACDRPALLAAASSQPPLEAEPDIVPSRRR